MTLFLEEWKPVRGMEGLYQVTNTGRVWSNRQNRELRAAPCNGYLRVTLFCGGRRHPVFVHRLVAEAFLGPRPQSLTVNHKDGRKSSNRPSNLEYLTAIENTRHAVLHGLSNRGSRHGLAKLDEEAVRQMRANPTAKTLSEWAEQFGCHTSNIERAISGKSWKHV